MKLLYNYEAFLPFRGGVARIFIELAKYGFSQSEINLKVFSGFNRSLFLKDEAGLRKKCCGIYIPPPLNKIRLLLPINRVFFALYSRWANADVCHYTNLDIPFVPKKTKTVITVHDLIDEIYDPRGMKCPRAIERRKALDRADGIICVSEITKKDLLKFYPDVDPLRVVVIYNGNDIQNIKPAPVEVKEPYLLYVGAREAGYKNFNVILEFLSSSDAFSDYSLVCFGGGQFSSAERKVITDLNLNNRVLHDGGADSKLVAYYKQAFALIYPSKYEGFGIPSVEAMSLGCPVVCSSAPPMPEVNGAGVLYFPPDDAEEMGRQLAEIKDREKRNRLVELGKQRAALFSWRKTCEETFAFYEQVLNMGSRR